METVQAIKEGKKVRRGHWNENSYIYDKGAEGVLNIDNKLAVFNSKDFEATDWEIIVEEKKTLSDKRHDNSQCADPWDYAEEDIKIHLKEFIDWCVHNPHEVKLPSIAVFKDKAREIFGVRLIQD